MKRLVLVAVMLATAASTNAQQRTHVDGYTRSNGTYVQPHDRTAPDRTRNDNWSTRGNTNPDTGVRGTKPRDEDTGYRPYNPYKPR
jgi:hypothetical protein